MNLLLVEDEKRVADFIARGLTAEGFTVTVARTGPEGRELTRQGVFDLIILDVMLPGMSGLDLCQELRASGLLTPILMLTALSAPDDKVQGLRLGADDYLTKPFSFDELLARIQALIRRSHRFQSEPRRIVVGGLVFDRETMEVTLHGNSVHLTAKELALLELFMTAPRKVFNRERILNNVWGYTADPLTNIVDVYIRRLRVKLAGDGEHPTIVTLRGHGYKLDPVAFD